MTHDHGASLDQLDSYVSSDRAQYATVSETLWHGNKSAEVKVVVESEGVSLCFQRVGNQRVCRTQNRVQMCVQCM